MSNYICGKCSRAHQPADACCDQPDLSLSRDYRASQPPAPHPETTSSASNATREDATGKAVSTTDGREAVGLLPELLPVAPAPSPLPTTEQVEQWKWFAIQGPHLLEGMLKRDSAKGLRALADALPSLVERARRADEMEKEIRALRRSLIRFTSLRSKVEALHGYEMETVSVHDTRDGSHRNEPYLMPRDNGPLVYRSSVLSLISEGT